MATIADVARRAGVSIATVSRVLSPGPRPHPVNPGTALRVRQAAADLDYVPSALASGLASRHSGLLGLVAPDLADPHYPRVAMGAEDVAREEGMALLVCNTLGDSARLAEYLRVLRARRVDAVVISGGGGLQPADLAQVEASGLRAVLIGRPAAATDLPYVAVDNEGAAREATQYLARGGRRSIVHLAGPLGQTTMADRARGYEAAMVVAGLPPRVIQTDGTPEGGQAATRALLATPAGERPDALSCATDRLAIGALGAAADAGARVPDDLAIIGFDDLPIAGYLRPSLASVAQPARHLGEVAIRLALSAAHGERPAPVVLPARLVPRESSGGRAAHPGGEGIAPGE